MSQLVSSLLPVTVEDQRYLFIVTVKDIFSNAITQEIEKHRDDFGESLGVDASVIQAYKARSHQIYKEVKAKHWDADTDTRMQSEDLPFILIISTDFNKFDPGAADWTILWLSDIEGEEAKLWRVLAKLADKVRRNENLFRYLTEASRKPAYARFIKYVDLKPGAFGMSVNIRMLIEDLIPNAT